MSQYTNMDGSHPQPESTFLSESTLSLPGMDRNFNTSSTQSHNGFHYLADMDFMPNFDQGNNYWQTPVDFYQEVDGCTQSSAAPPVIPSSAGSSTAPHFSGVYGDGHTALNPVVYPQMETHDMNTSHNHPGLDIHHGFMLTYNDAVSQPTGNLTMTNHGPLYRIPSPGPGMHNRLDIASTAHDYSSGQSVSALGTSGGTRSVEKIAVTAKRTTKKRERNAKKPYSKPSKLASTAEPGPSNRRSRSKSHYQSTVNMDLPRMKSDLQIIPCCVSTCNRLFHGQLNLENHLKTIHHISGAHQNTYKCPYPGCTSSSTKKFTKDGVKNHAVEVHGCQYTNDDLTQETFQCTWNKCTEVLTGSSFLRHVLTHSNVTLQCPLCSKPEYQNTRYAVIEKHFMDTHPEEMEKYGVWYLEKQIRRPNM